MYAWDASDGVRPDAAAGASPALHPHHLGVAVGILAARAPDVLALAGCPSVLMVLPPDAPARNKPGALPSAA